MKNYAYTYKGNLEFYFETGFECSAVILHDDRGLHKSPSFNNATQNFDGPEMEFKSISWATFIHGGEFLRVFKDGQVLWEGTLTKDRLKMVNTNFVLSFIPKEVPFDTWVSWFEGELRAEIMTDTPVLADDKENKNAQ